MKGIIIIIGLILSICFDSYSQVYVNGYYKKDGTYVQPHYRSSPNSTKMDNYSTKGNVNPYTGKEGTKEVYDENYSRGYKDSPKIQSDIKVEDIDYSSRNVDTTTYKGGKAITCPLGLTFGETDKDLICDAMKRKLMCDSIIVNSFDALESHSVSFAGDFYNKATCLFIDEKLYRIVFHRFVNHFELAVMLLEDLYNRLYDKYGECDISTIHKEDEYISLTWVDDNTNNVIILWATKNKLENNYFCTLRYESNSIQEESSNNEL